jgi:hypothetical protein
MNTECDVIGAPSLVLPVHLPQLFGETALDKANCLGLGKIIEQVKVYYYRYDPPKTVHIPLAVDDRTRTAAATICCVDKMNTKTGNRRKRNGVRRDEVVKQTTLVRTIEQLTDYTAACDVTIPISLVPRHIRHAAQNFLSARACQQHPVAIDMKTS